MKNKYIHIGLVASSVILSLSLLSNSNGPGGNRTGAPGSSGDCSGCHGANPDPTGEIILSVMENGTKVTQYQPGKTYDLELLIKGNSSKMGFQLSAINDKNTVSGSISQTSSGTQAYNSGNQQIWGHSSPGTSANSNTWTAKWTAPSNNSGDVRMFIAAILANSNGNNNGDYFLKQTFTLSEEAQNSIAKTSDFRNSIIQNPITDILYLKNTIKEAYIWDNQGKMVLKFVNSSQVNLQKLSPGVYNLNYTNTDGSTGSGRFVKN